MSFCAHLHAPVQPHPHLAAQWNTCVVRSSSCCSSAASATPSGCCSTASSAVPSRCTPDGPARPGRGPVDHPCVAAAPAPSPFISRASPRPKSPAPPLAGQAATAAAATTVSAAAAAATVEAPAAAAAAAAAGAADAAIGVASAAAGTAAAAVAAMAAAVAVDAAVGVAAVEAVRCEAVDSYVLSSLRVGDAARSGTPASSRAPSLRPATLTAGRALLPLTLLDWKGRKNAPRRPRGRGDPPAPPTVAGAYVTAAAAAVAGTAAAPATAAASAPSPRGCVNPTHLPARGLVRSDSRGFHACALAAGVQASDVAGAAAEWRPAVGSTAVAEAATVGAAAVGAAAVGTGAGALTGRVARSPGTTTTFAARWGPTLRTRLKRGDVDSSLCAGGCGGRGKCVNEVWAESQGSGQARRGG